MNGFLNCDATTNEYFCKINDFFKDLPNGLTYKVCEKT